MVLEDGVTEDGADDPSADGVTADGADNPSADGVVVPSADGVTAVGVMPAVGAEVLEDGAEMGSFSHLERDSDSAVVGADAVSPADGVTPEAGVLVLEAGVGTEAPVVTDGNPLRF